MSHRQHFTEHGVDNRMQTSERVPESVRDHVLSAKCEACGHNWKIQRYEALRCPYCQNEPERVIFRGTYVTLVDEASRRWLG